MNFGQRIKALRKSKGLNQTQLAEEINVHVNTVSNWERAEHPLGDIDKLLRLAAYFEIDISYLLSNNTDSTPTPVKANAINERHPEREAASTEPDIEQKTGELFFKSGDNEVRLPDTPSNRELFVTIVNKMLEANRQPLILREATPAALPASVGVSQTA